MKAASTTLLAFVAVFVQSPAGPIAVTDGWAKSGQKGRGTAAYLTIQNSGPRTLALLSATSDAAARIEIHTMEQSNEQMTMKKVNRVDVPAAGKVVLRPGGLHLMLYGLNRSLAPGDEIVVSLGFDDGTTRDVTCKVRSRNE